MSRAPRHRRSRTPRHGTTQSWVHLAFFVLILLFLVLFRRQFGEGAAGCFAKVTVPPDAPLPTLPTGDAPVGEGPRSTGP